MKGDEAGLLRELLLAHRAGGSGPEVEGEGDEEGEGKGGLTSGGSEEETCRMRHWVSGKRLEMMREISTLVQSTEVAR